MLLPCIFWGECSKSYWKLLREGTFSRIPNSNHLSQIHKLRDFLILNFIHLLQSKVLATQQLHAFVIINHLETQQKNQRVYWYNAVFVVEATFKSRKGTLAR
jgi:hypothetical protein